MNDIPLSILIIILIILLLFSAFFSGSETGMMSLNKHRIKHLAEQNNKSAKRILELLQRPDRLLGIILLGNNFINIFAASLATIIGIRIWGDIGVLIMTVVLTVFLLIFGEVAPKTYAALNPEKFAFPASFVLKLISKPLYPIVVVINTVANFVLKMFGIKKFSADDESISKEELKSILNTKSNKSNIKNHNMMLGALHLDDVDVSDIMITKGEMVGLDFDMSLDFIKESIITNDYARLLIHKDNFNEIIGVLHAGDVLKLYSKNLELTKESIKSIIKPPYFIPENAPLRTQLSLFQKTKRHTAIAVDEYGDIVGLITIEDILEYVVGDLGLQEIQEESDDEQEIIKKSKNSYQIQGSASVKFINKELNWNLPSDGPKTLGGVFLERTGAFPVVGQSIDIGNYSLSVLSFSENRIKQLLVVLNKISE